MKIQLLLFCLVVLTNTIYAQKAPDILPSTNPQTIIDALKADPDVVWMGETMVDYVDTNGLENAWCSYNNIEKEQLLKYQSGRVINGNTPTRVIDVLFAISKKQKVYVTEKLEKERSEKSLKTIRQPLDTVITFDPETFEQIVQIVVSDYTVVQTPKFRVRQLLYFDKNTRTFLTKPLAVAPLLKRGKYYIPLFWVAPLTREDFDLSSNDISLAKRLFAEIDLKSIKVLKSKKNQDAAFKLFAENIIDSKKEMYLTHPLRGDGITALNRAERATVTNSVDTIITFDPETFEEIIQVVVYKYDGADTEKIQLIEDWFFDANKGKIQITPLGIGIVAPRNDSWEDCMVQFVHITNPSFIKSIRATMRTE